MSTFIWTMIIILAVEIMGKLHALVAGDFQRPTPAIKGLEIIISIALMSWGLVIVL